MNWFLLYLLVAVSVGMVVPGLRRPAYRLQFPCLAGGANLFLLILPLASLINHPEEVSPGALSRFSVMAILCVLAAWAGYTWWHRAPSIGWRQFEPHRIAIS